MFIATLSILYSTIDPLFLIKNFSHLVVHRILFKSLHCILYVDDYYVIVLVLWCRWLLSVGIASCMLMAIKSLYWFCSVNGC